MRLTVLGGCGAWPGPGQACSGYLIERDGFRLLIDPGYAVVPRLLAHVPADGVDAVLVSHGHPDHCADLSPLLRARALGEERPPPLPVYAPPGALDAVLALDRPAMLAGTYAVHPLGDGAVLDIGPFRVSARALPHSVPNLGFRLAAAGAALAYTGDTGPSERIAGLAADADLLLAEATHVDRVPAGAAAYLSSARQAAGSAVAAGVGRLVLTHLWPGTDPAAALGSAGRVFRGPTDIATAGLTVDLP
jgi:ribonuclease BN (tRNA processing enzyme)